MPPRGVRTGLDDGGVGREAVGELAHARAVEEAHVLRNDGRKEAPPQPRHQAPPGQHAGAGGARHGPRARRERELRAPVPGLRCFSISIVYFIFRKILSFFEWTVF